MEITQATMRLAGRRVADASRHQVLGVNDLDALKKSLQELRNAQASYLELEKARGGLIPREQVCTIVTSAVSRLVRVLSSVENSIATELAIWISDPKIRDTPNDARNRLVRQFVAKTTSDARNLEAQSVDELIAEAARDD
jgi:hypothetical protein